MRLLDCLPKNLTTILMILVGQVFVIEYANVSAIRHHLQTNQWFPDNPAYSFAQYSLVVSRAGGYILAFLHVKTGELPTFSKSHFL